MLDGYVGADVESGAKTLDWNVGKVVETSWMMGREKGCLRNVLCIVLILLNVNMMATYWMASEVQGITVAKRQEKNDVACYLMSELRFSTAVRPIFTDLGNHPKAGVLMSDIILAITPKLI